MARKAKKLQELQTMFDENDIDFSTIQDIIVIKDLITRVEKIPDFRDESYVKHKLSNIVVLTLFAVLSNANEWSEIEAFGIKFTKAVRGHWGVKNRLHWHLDFTFKYDKNTTMNKNGAKNLQIVKKIALSILRTVQTFYKVSLKMIRYRLSLDFDNEISTIYNDHLNRCRINFC